jgi:N-hydroxyarylamine O-acetyltransferase
MAIFEGEALDLAAYLRRIDDRGDVAPSAATLARLHLAHATHIPFENLDILRGLPIRLDLASLQAKLVAARRGGYCFEQNLLFAAVLEAIGFAVTPLAARVRFGTTAVLPRTHMLLSVDVGEARYLADVGFGADGLLMPLDFRSPATSRQFAWTYRIVAEHDAWVLQSLKADAWIDLYAFTLERQQRVDYELANWYTSTHPASRFVRAPIAQRLSTEWRRMLRGRDYSEERGGELTRRTLANDDEVVAVLAEAFGVDLPRGTRLAPRVPP